jgi:hypothetical protein
MKKDYVDLDQEVALFRFGVIADLVHLRTSPARNEIAATAG